MGATRLASGIFQQPRLAEKCNVHTLNKGSQTALITRLSVSLCLKFRATRLLKNSPNAGRVAPH